MVKSPAFSFEGWELLEFLKGRKRWVVGILGAFLGYIIMDSEVAALISGSLVEIIFALGEYFIKSRE